MATFHVSLVARVPRLSGPPVLVEVDRLVPSSISYTDELNRPGVAAVSCKVATLSDAVKERLARLDTFPCEVWIYRDSTLAWAGEVQSLGVQSQAVALNCVGLLGYLQRMGITADTTFAQVDQHTIVKTLVNTWQALSYGHYGIDTTGGVPSGVLRDQAWLRKDQKDVLAAVTELGKIDTGFDVWVDPASRRLRLTSPERGTDLSASVVLDSRSIATANVVQSVAPDDLVSDVGATGTGQDELGTGFSLYSYQTNAATHARYGRSWRSQTFDNVTEQTVLDGKALAYLAPRAFGLVQPGVTIRPNVGVGVLPGAFGPGDEVGYAFDAGIGMQSGTFRVAKVSVAIDDDGQQSMGVEFA